jgi:hypothetical protein
MTEITLDRREWVESENWRLELIDSENIRPRPCLLLIDLGALPVKEIQLPLPASPARVDLARTITFHAPRHVAYELAKLAPTGWVAPDPPR